MKLTDKWSSLSVTIDFTVPECTIDKHYLVSGDTTAVDARVRIIRTGLPDLSPNWYPDYHTAFHLVDRVKWPTVGELTFHY